MTDTDSGKRLSDAEIAEMRAFAKSLDGNYWINIDKDRLLKNHLALLSQSPPHACCEGMREKAARVALGQIDHDNCRCDACNALRCAAASIRALPVSADGSANTPEAFGVQPRSHRMSEGEK